MDGDKTIPPMTGVTTLLKNKNSFELVLRFLDKISRTDDECAEFIKNIPDYHLNKYTAKNSISRLAGYYFLKREGNIYSLSEHSQEFLSGKLRFEDYILKCLQHNLEWSYFLEDIYTVVKEFGPIGISEIISHLQNDKRFAYARKNWDRAYLVKILPLLDLVHIIKYENSIAIIGEREQKDIFRYSRFLQRELLKNLQMALRRKYPKTTLARYYRTTVKTYIPSVNWKKREIAKTQEEIDDILLKRIKPEKIKINGFTESQWKLIDGLWNWQKEFLETWFKTKQGIVKVVTGAGKTHLAMAIIENLHKECDDLHVTIVVPTIVLLEQWYDNLTQKLQIAAKDIALRGGGYTDTFDQKKILIVVINSAIKENFIERETHNIKNNLLIVDECHRSGAQEFRKIFNTNRKWDLGLSATPEREIDNAFEDILVKQLGPIIGSYTYNDALRDKIIPAFNIYNYAVLLNNQERVKYERISKEIQKTIERLKYRYPQLNDPKVKLEIVLKTLQKKNPQDRDLFLYFQKTKERKADILYPAENRKKFVKMILEKIIEKEEKNPILSENSPILKVSSKDKVILFHEKIDEINSLFINLDGKNASIYHSELPNTLNRIGLNLYQSGQTKVLLSVKALVEGVDVPKTNIGIIMASSSSQTQRIQSLGRVLRKAEGKDETNLFIVYVKNSTDERIYRKKIDWNKIMGKGNIEFRLWSEFGESLIDPPQTKMIKNYIDLDLIDENMLKEGCIYPGKYEGEQFSFDSRGRLFRKTFEGRLYVREDVADLWKNFRRYKPAGGRLIINGLGHTLIKFKKEKRLETIYLGTFKFYLTEKNKS
jgi:superfamily II DNA or RNA helicase